MGRTISSGRRYGRRDGVAYDPRIFKMYMSMELRERLREDEEKRRYKRQLAGAYWLQRATVAFWALRDGVPGGEAWFDDDANVPAYGPARERALVVEARVREEAELPLYKASLYRDVFIWTDAQGAFLFQRTDKDHWTPISFADADAARKFVDGLAYSDIYGGFIVGGQKLELQAQPTTIQKAD